MSLSPSSIVITGDKDFGELIFKEKERLFCSYIFRYEVGEEENIIKSLLSLLKNHSEELYKSFVIITSNRIRIRFV